ncbi:lipopolysaccharide assembly protein LapA domain-containing protein [Stenotrophomonas maltophilia]|uniref:lipopolysaccharide assembly protein LapA domain-containing protein n=1 Tax=Stenotrophomonas maltophilia TaxID=40324 RepID=UPI0021BEA71B|nr:lipopolysaccharide assembly protein LapA domain-containing protein [Stenotrophomonas maltophilia]UXL27377.1 lipopolysaccharide assembly protein LapA domain-containing protein [Stenotrophomonas maltophilia]
MKVFRLLVLLAVLILGLIIGAVNMTAMSINLLFTQLHTSVGVALIAALLVGVVVGAGLVLVSVVIPLYSQLRRANKSVAATPAAGVSPNLLMDADRRWISSPSGFGFSCSFRWPHWPGG